MDDTEMNSSGSDGEEFDSYYDFSYLGPIPPPTLPVLQNPSFSQPIYRCYHLALDDKPNLEGSSQILAPPSVLNSPLLLPSGWEDAILEIRSNRARGRVSHCCVSEFTADEGSVHLPSWMMENLKLEDGDFVNLRRTVLEKATYVKLQVHSVDFLDMGYLKSALEECLTNKFLTLTMGDTIRIRYKGKSYTLDVVDTKPANAVNIIRTGCVVDFGRPLDYKEAQVLPISAQLKDGVEEGSLKKKEPFQAFSGKKYCDGLPFLFFSVGLVLLLLLGKKTHNPN